MQVSIVSSWLAIFICFAAVRPVEAAMRYVNAESGNPSAPYTNWLTAATVIQDAIDVAEAGDEIVVTNGTYQTGGRTIEGGTPNRIAITKPLVVRSVNGPGVTIIQGVRLEGSEFVRCAYLTNGASLIAFTLTNGLTKSSGPFGLFFGGGGVYCESTNALVSNCVLIGNTAARGGGAFLGTLQECTLAANSARSISVEELPGDGGGALGSVLINCTLTKNIAALRGGGAYGGVLTNCTLVNNSAGSGGAASGGPSGRVILNGCHILGNTAISGGGVHFGALSNCTLMGNTAESDGGGTLESELERCTVAGNRAYEGGGVSSSTLDHCHLSGNFARNGGGSARSTLNDCVLETNTAFFGTCLTCGVGGGAYMGTLNRCVLKCNTARFGGGACGGAENIGGLPPVILNNCVLTANSAEGGGGVWFGVLNNCTLSGNTATESGGGALFSTLTNSIVYFNTAPTCSNYHDLPDQASLNHCCTTPLPGSGTGNITNAPLLLDPAVGDFRLQSHSPCVNAGSNSSAPSGLDLDGNPRIVGGTVDIGAYEFQSPQSAISYAWLQQYDLPTDGSVDLTDPDGDGHNNRQEWRAWTDPTNSASALRLLAPTVSADGLLVRWQSVSGPTYFLERSIDLGAQPVFAPLASNIVGQPGATIYTDTNAVGPGPFFYRVRVTD